LEATQTAKSKILKWPMSNDYSQNFSGIQQFALVSLRTLIGWHFLYEAYYKLAAPAWSPAGGLLAPWSAAGYLKGASGPLAGLFQRLINSGFTNWIDRGVKIGLLLIGLSLLLGLFTRLGSWAALLFLSLVYFLYVPTMGVPQPNAEGTYLIVNKTLIEAAAVIVLLAFDTGKIAGLDLLFRRRLITLSKKTAVSDPETQPAHSIRKHHELN
jgi:thiosulfate dehydrogenase [quinone] large subunit